MFSEILKIVPKLDQAALNKMQASLTKRFGQVAKKFGSGLKAAVVGGGILGLASTVIDKLLNPLKETQDAMDAILNRSDDLGDMAEQFNTSTGNLLKLQTLAKAKGLDPDELNVMIGKFQTAVAEAKADPSKESSVRNFVDEKDTAEGFFKYIQAIAKLAKVDPNAALLAQKDTFGQKLINKQADLISGDPAEFLANMNLPNSQSLSAAIDQAANVGSYENFKGALRDFDNFVASSQAIGFNNVDAKDVNQRLKDKLARDKFSYQESMAKIDGNLAVVTGQLDKVLLELGRGVTSLGDVKNLIGKIPVAKFIRGVLPFGKGSD